LSLGGIIAVRIPILIFMAMLFGLNGNGLTQREQEYRDKEFGMNWDEEVISHDGA
jgi:hypothetical protein